MRGVVSDAPADAPGMSKGAEGAAAVGVDVVVGPQAPSSTTSEAVSQAKRL